jgi:hypothetical protein
MSKEPFCISVSTNSFREFNSISINIHFNLASVNTSAAVTMVTIGNTATPIATMTPAGSRSASIVPLQQPIQVNISNLLTLYMFGLIHVLHAFLPLVMS